MTTAITKKQAWKMLDKWKEKNPRIPRIWKSHAWDLYLDGKITGEQYHNWTKGKEKVT